MQSDLRYVEVGPGHLAAHQPVSGEFPVSTQMGLFPGCTWQMGATLAMPAESNCDLRDDFADLPDTT